MRNDKLVLKNIADRLADLSFESEDPGTADHLESLGDRINHYLKTGHWVGVLKNFN